MPLNPIAFSVVVATCNRPGPLSDCLRALRAQSLPCDRFEVIVVDDRSRDRTPEILRELEEKYKVAYQTGLELVTIRYFDQSTIDRVMINKELILEQRGLQNIELLIRDLG